jgi:lipopolysaccharide assembly outer membrane protein LptD (OstA)
VRWEAVRLSVAQAYDIDRAISDREPFRDMQAEFIVDPNNIFRFRADASYNMYDLGLRFANADLIARFRDFGVSLGSRYNAISNTNFVVGEATARITNNIDTFVSTNWDVASGTLIEQRIGVDWRFQCFAIMAEYILRHQADNEFRFAVNLLGVGQLGTKVGAGP